MCVSAVCNETTLTHALHYTAAQIIQLDVCMHNVYRKEGMSPWTMDMKDDESVCVCVWWMNGMRHSEPVLHDTYQNFDRAKTMA